MTEGHRCPLCEATLVTADQLTAGECGCRHRGDWQHGDIILNPKTNGLLRGELDRYSQRILWVELVPIGQGQYRTPAGAVLVCRTVDGERLPVVSLADGELLTVRNIA